MTIVGKWRAYCVALVLVVLSCALAIPLVLADPVACCLESRPGFPQGFCFDYGANLLTQSAVDECNAASPFFALNNVLCNAVPGQTAQLFPGCQIGCCCLTQNGNVVQDTVFPTSLDQCSVMSVYQQGQSRVFVALADLSNLQASCDAICGVPGQPIQVPDTTCEGQGYSWCAPGNSPGSLVPNSLISDEGTRGPLRCYDQPCFDGNSCSAAGGVLVGPGQFCSLANQVPGIAGCCSPGGLQDMTCTAGNPQGFGGALCALPQACAGTDFTGQLSLAQRQILGNNRCCQNLGPGNSCVVSQQCVPQASTELLCNDQVDNDCDGLLDAADPDCNARVIGMVALYNADPQAPVQPVPNVLFRLVGIVAPNLPPDVYYTYSTNDGSFIINNMAPATYTPYLVEGQQHYSLESGNQPFNLFSGGTHNVNLRLSIIGVHTLSGRVVEAVTNTPVAGALVYVASRPYQAYTGSDGRYTITTIYPGTDYNVYAYHPQFALSERRVVNIPPTSTLDFSLIRAACGVQASAPLLSGAIDRVGARDIRLTWNQQACDFEYLEVYRCQGGLSSCPLNGNVPSSPQYVLLDRISASQTISYLDGTTVWDSNYTYVVKLKVRNQEQALYSGRVSVFTGNVRCEGRTAVNEFCVKEFNGLVRIQDAGFRCDANNIASYALDANAPVNCMDPSLTCDEYIVNGLVKTRCVSSLDSCTLLGSIGDPFNLYANGLVDGGADSCRSYDIEPGVGSRCYYDVGQTNVNACLACNAQTSCSTYQSSATCLADPCGVGVGQHSCQWIPFDNSLGLGTCLDAAAPSCEDCQGANGVLGACPSATVCESAPFSQPGNACFFNALDSSCTSCEQVSCYDLLDQASCLGSDLQRSPFTFSTLSFEPDPTAKCGLNNCVWIEPNPGFGFCARDDNNDGRNDCVAPEFTLTSGDITLGLSAILCRQDKSPPQTTLVTSDVHDPNGVTSLAFNVFEESNAFYSRVRTYFCIEPADGSFLCDGFDRFEQVPVSRVVQISNMSYNGTLDFALSPGDNIIRYFSKDAFNNYEEMRTRVISVDDQPPEFDLYVTTTQGSGVPLLHSVLLTAEMHSGQAQCTLDLKASTDGPCIGTCSSFGPFLSYHTRLINGVPDGHYIAVATCRDAFNNEYTLSQDVFMDFDTRAINPLPHGPVDTTDVLLSIQTTDFVLCKYSTQPNLYANIPDGNILTASPSFNAVTGLYTHQRLMSFAPDAGYTLYYICNFAPSNTIDAATFVVDTQTPSVVVSNHVGVRLTDPSVQHIITNPQITVSCEDLPAIGGFGCAQLRYCADALGNPSCTPLLVDGTTIQRTLPGSSRVCVTGVEAVINTMGGRQSPIVCYDLLFDSAPPRLFIDEYTSVISTNQVSIRGSVLDPAYLRQFWTLSQATPVFIESQELLSTTNFVFTSRIIAPLGAQTGPVIDFYFRYLNDANTYIVKLDGSDRNPVGSPAIKILEVRNNQPAVLASGYFSGWSSQSQIMNLTVDVRGDTLMVRLDDFVLEASSSNLVTAPGRRIGARKDPTSQVTLSTIEVFDYDAAQDNRVVYRKRMTGQTQWGAPQFVPATPQFTILDTLEPSAGASVEYILRGVDQANLESPPQTISVLYDNDAPLIHGLVVSPLASGQHDFIEYGEDGYFTVNVSDRGFFDNSAVSRVWVDLGAPAYGSYDIPYNVTASRWRSLLPTSTIQALGNIDVVVHSQDIAGNVRSRTFSGDQGLRIRDTTNPFINLEFDVPYYTGNDRPTLVVNTSEPASCTLNYTSASGQVRVESFQQVGQQRYSVTLGASLLCGEDASIPTTSSITCQDQQQNSQTFVFDIICDRRGPVAGFSIPGSAAQIGNYTKTHKEYFLVPGEQVRFSVVADEPVQCRYCEVGTHQGCSASTSFSAMQGVFSNVVEDVYTMTDETASFVALPAVADGQFHLLCRDQVGNIGVGRTLTVRKLENLPPVLFNVMSNVSSSRFVTVFAHTKSLPDTTCALSISPSSINVIMNKQNLPGQMTVRHHYVATLDDGQYQVIMTCSAQGQTTVREIPLSVNTVAPQLVSLTPSPSQTHVVNESYIRLSGTAPGASMLVVERQGQEAISVPVLSSQGHAFDVPVGLQTGVNSLEVKAVSSTGLAVGQSVIVESSSSLNVVEVQGLRTHSTQGGLSSLPVLVLGSQTYGATLEVFSVVDGNFQSLGTRQRGLEEVYEYPVVLRNGKNYFYATVTKDGRIIAANNFVIVLDDLAARVFSQVPVSSISESDGFLGRVSYDNVIVDRRLHVGSVQTELLQRLDVLSAFNLPSGLNLLNLSLVNDLGHTARLSSYTSLDNAAPHLVSYTIEGSNGTETASSRPRIALQFNEPTRILDAYYGTDMNNRLGFADDYGTTRVIETLTPLASPGTYYITVRFADQFDNANTNNGVAIQYVLTPFNLTLRQPRFGVSPTFTFVFQVESTRDASCRWIPGDSTLPFGAMTPFQTTGYNLHTVETFTMPTGYQENAVLPVTVLCEEIWGTPIQETRRVFNISVDTTPPQISSVSVQPTVDNVVVQWVPSVNVTAHANEDVICTYRETPNGEFMNSMIPGFVHNRFSPNFSFDVPVTNNRTYALDIVCFNRAGLNSTFSRSFSTNFNAQPTIIIESPPQGAVGNLTGNLTVRTTRPTDVSGCTFRVNNGSVTGFAQTGSGYDYFYSGGLTFVEGQNSIAVSCTIQAIVYTNSRQFIADTTPPRVNSVDDRNITGSLRELQFTIDATDTFNNTPGSGIAFYEYQIGTALEGDQRWNVRNGTSTNRAVTANSLNLTADTVYYVTVRAKDNVGLYSTWVSSDGVRATPQSSAMCADGVRNGNETGIDCGGNCPGCPAGGICRVNADCSSGSCVLGLCGASTTCTNNVLDPGETDIDCGGSCPACADGRACVLNRDCSGLSCHNSVCSQASCSDSLINGLETDVDCGGPSCPSCQTDMNCRTGNDCQSGVCSQLTCAAPSCSDLVKNGLETDIDCGGTCGGCSDGLRCSQDRDCSSGLRCTNGYCAGDADLDSDGDGIPDAWERRHGMNPFDPTDADLDFDGDGMTNYEEYVYTGAGRYPLGQLDPNNPDTDGDSHNDGREVAKNTDPLDPLDYPGARWLSILLILFAFIIVGGVLGYFGYHTYIQHTRPKRSISSNQPLYSSVSSGSPLFGVPPVAGSSGPKSKSDLLKQALQKELRKQRHSTSEGTRDKTFQRFGSDGFSDETQGVAKGVRGTSTVGSATTRADEMSSDGKSSSRNATATSGSGDVKGGLASLKESSGSGKASSKNPSQSSVKGKGVQALSKISSGKGSGSGRGSAIDKLKATNKPKSSHIEKLKTKITKGKKR